PVLRSLWFPLHTLSAALAYGLFGVAAGLGLTGLVERDGGARASLLGRMERAAGWGFLWLTLSLLLGGIWARYAWGRYWGWDPKETWTLVVWLLCLLPLHLRPLPAWRGRRQIALVLLGFVGVLFLLLAFPWVIRVTRLESLHGF
ncbi:MAG: cytochrome c biogenesis protein CcsA, partial [Anaerolineae bacterium]